MSQSLETTKGGNPSKYAALQEKLKALESVVTRPELPRLFHQLVIFVLDGSGSMTYPGISGSSKGNEVEEVVKSVLHRLQESKNDNCFDVTVFGYAVDHLALLPQSKVKDLDISGLSLNPCDHVLDSTSTHISGVMSQVFEETTSYLESSGSARTEALIILLSDGLIHDLEEAQDIIDKLHEDQRVHLATIFVEDSGEMSDWFDVDWEEASNALRELSTNQEEHVVSSFDPEEIRKQMIKSISLVSKRLGA